MQITVSQEMGRVPVTIMHVAGNIDSTSYEQFQAQALGLIHNGSHNLLLDLHDVPFISSAGLRAINQIYNALRERSESQELVSKGVTAGTYKSPHLKLLSPNRRVMEVLRMSGFDMFLDIQSNLHDAVASF
jgi:anti-anti-sigma factor